MKYHKIFSTLMIGCLLTLASCDDDEKLNLTQYPDNDATITSDANKDEEGLINLRYNEDGKIEETISRTYTYRFIPSPEDIKLTYEIISSNIPADKIKISKKEEIVETGYAEGSVTISLTDLDFIKHEIEENYELGVIAKASGFKLPETSMTSKFSIKKETYVANYSIVAEEGSNAEFVRYYDGVGIINKEPMSYSFKVMFDKPLLEEITVNIAPKNTSESVLKALSLSDKTVTIAAGKKESKIVTLSIADDFLLTTTEAEIHLLELHAEASASNNAAAGDDVVQFTIKKEPKFFELLKTIEPTWVNIDKAGWSASSENNISGSISNIIDGVGKKYMFSADDSFSLVIDMAKQRTIKGLGLSYFSAYIAKSVEISVSDDNTTWKKQGVVTAPRMVGEQNFKFLRPTEARYVKFKFDDKYEWAIALLQVYAYE